MVRDRAHGVIGDAGGCGATHPGWVGEEGRERTVAAVVKVDVDAAEVGEHEVANGVRALDGLGVGVEGREEPGVFGCNEGAGFGVRPELGRLLELACWLRCFSLDRSNDLSVGERGKGGTVLCIHSLYVDLCNSSGPHANARARSHSRRFGVLS